MRERCRSPKAVRSLTTASQSTSGVRDAPAQVLLVVPPRLGQLVRQGLRPQQVAHRDAAPAGLVLVGRADAAQRRPDLARATLVLGERLEAAVVRQDQVRPVGDEQVVADLDPRRQKLAELALHRDRVDHDAVADHAQDARVQDARGDQVQHELAPAHDHGVARVVAAVVAGHHLHVRGEKIDDLPLPLVAPLGAGDHDVGHVLRVFPVLVQSSAGSGSPCSSGCSASVSKV